MCEPKKSRKEYFKEYYLKNKEKYKREDENNSPPKKRGRPKKIIPPFEIKKLSTPIIITFD